MQGTKPDTRTCHATTFGIKPLLGWQPAIRPVAKLYEMGLENCSMIC